jgi:hypothetical protein
MGINGSSPRGYSAVIQSASSHVQQQNNAAHASRPGLAIRSPGRGLDAPGDVMHGSGTGGCRRFALDRLVDRAIAANSAIRVIGVDELYSRQHLGRQLPGRAYGDRGAAAS